MFKKLRQIPNAQKFRYALIVLSIGVFFSPWLFIPQLVGNDDLCGPLCLRRFYLYFPGMDLADLWQHIRVAFIGAGFLGIILVSTLFFGRIWCSYICPVGGLPELLSRMLNDRWKIEYRSLPQVPIRYGYFSVYLVLFPMLGVSACTLCNFMTVPRMFEAFSGEIRGFLYILSAIGLTNLGLFLLLGVFASKGRAYCQFLCPIGAIDALVNRVAAKFHFTRRIRVERNRCTGCNQCAKNCMCGAIKMVDKIAVVDQLSCMSCHECVDVCDWSAIDWRHNPIDKTPKRKKKGIDFHPQPTWISVHKHTPPSRLKINWQRVIFSIIMLTMLGFIIITEAIAAQRYPDPDGCQTCHALPNLAYRDKQGLLRNASIDNEHYYASLHGSVPCRDCHRKITQYPHDPKNGAVDCGASCHLEEPSDQKAYSHEDVIKEFQHSAHAQGWSKNLTAENRLEEVEQETSPSCRWCHNNSLYIEPDKITQFQHALDHHDQACGTCHQGIAWRDRIGGHILRRFIGARWSKAETNQVCQNCHGDIKKMQNLTRKDAQTGEEKKPSADFIHASQTYDMTLHGRLIAKDNAEGASCNDCHAPQGLHHNHLSAQNHQSSTHPNQLATSCGQSDCHAYANNPLNAGFLNTNLHDVKQLPVDFKLILSKDDYLNSNWFITLIIILPVLLLLIVGSLLWSILIGPWAKPKITAIVGGKRFLDVMLGNPRLKK
ncbi:4Fe-4S binding protein [Candidatus Venteria ishoeyi]|uniref:Putative electron transport protein YccM n=1 Tax=Candidatus Venteria ishoeyi TaxID=1899563 RepID=A0A1H6FFX1_9GAMM|nr:4Fe-4S binding protein [Candidatus Venteria ishoeyi]SEH07935.1 Putative electron transport protein YccM [Candidatus Venteria ishoeyi]